jgi:hypothetical protein
MNGRRAFSAVYNEGGMERGNVDKKGAKIEGVELCSDLGYVKTYPKVKLIVCLTLIGYIHPLPVVWHAPML